MAKALDTLLNTLAEKLGMGDDGAGLLTALKATAFKPAKVNGTYVAPTDGQLMALLVVANQYGLNPWLKEIYAFPDKHGGIVPVVGVDGWSRIINNNPVFDGVEFEQDEVSCTCTIYRKDRSHPTRITEYMVECRGTQGAWLTHPYRFLRHKALIQCARIAFGFGGIYDLDEAERILETVDASTGEIENAQPAKPRRASETAALAAPTEPVVLVPKVATLPPEADPMPAQVAAAAPVQKPAQAPTPTPADAIPSEPASGGECMNVLKTAVAKKRNLSEVLKTLGFNHLDPENLAGLSKAEFKAIKAVL